MFRRLLLSAAALVFVAGTAFAAGYDDFAAGVSAYERRNFDQAISSFTAALDAPDLSSSMKVTAYLDRASSYLHSNKCAPAISDLTAAKAIDPNNIDVLVELGEAQVCARDFKAALVLFDAVIATDPYPNSFFVRGRARWAAGDFAGAVSDFAALDKAAPRYPYAVIWFAISQMRIGSLDTKTFGKFVDHVDTDRWPGPLILFMEGERTADDVRAAAVKGDPKSTDPKLVTGQQCEADFYIGEWQIAHNDVASAKAAMQSSISICPEDFIELDAAKIEAARLN